MTVPRLLIVGAFPEPGTGVFGGIVTSCRALVDSSFSRRFALTLVDSTQISNPPPGLGVRLVLAARRMARFVFRLAATRPAAVLLFASAGASLLEKGLMAWIVRLSGRPALLFPRGGRVMDRARESRLQRLWIRLAFRGATVVLCQGRAWQSFAIDDLGFEAERALIVPNWTATEALLAIGAARAPAPPGLPLRLLFLGWLEPEKGVFELIDACAGLPHETAFSLTIAGKGHAEAPARERVTASGLAERVHFAGWIEGVELQQALAAHDVLVLPSWAEGLPNAMIESMAAGLAVVVTAVGNIPDVVVDGEHALLVPPRNVAALRAALLRVLGDPALHRRLQSGGHGLAASGFSVEPAMDKLAAAVLDAIAADR